MTKTSPPVVFFGSGPVAAASLQALTKYCTVEAVITKPRPPHHHGPVPVLDLATDLNLPIHTVNSRHELDTLFGTVHFASQLGVLVDFGIIVSQLVIDYFPLGIINSHFSLLPEWRGADPITFAVLSGQANTGVSLMLLVEKMDEGPLLAFAEHELATTITTPQLTEELTELSDALLQEMLPAYVAGHVTLMPQSVTNRAVSYSRRLTKEDGRIDWTKPAAEIERHIRAFAGWPKSYTQLDTVDCTIIDAAVVAHTGKPGSLTVIDKSLIVHCGTDSLRLKLLKPAGKPAMSDQAFLAGYKTQLPLQ